MSHDNNSQQTVPMYSVHTEKRHQLTHLFDYISSLLVEYVVVVFKQILSYETTYNTGKRLCDDRPMIS